MKKTNVCRLVKPNITVQNTHSEFMEDGNKIQTKMTRTVKRTITSIRKNEESIQKSTESANFNSGEELNQKWISKTGNVHNYATKLFLADKQNEITTNITQNERNQLIEDARAAANGNTEVSALELYKKSGRYWDVYPKTDWTYSMHSRDRVELAPGVVAMPNMSRKTIHSAYRSNNNVTNFSQIEENNLNYRSKLNEYEDVNIRRFSSRSYNNEYKFNEKITYIINFWKKKITNLITNIFILPLSIFYHFLDVQTSWLAKLHVLTSRIMLLDTWLLWKINGGNKSAKLLTLCLVPLFLLGGWWAFSNFDSIIKELYINSTPSNLSDENNKNKKQDGSVKLTDDIHLESSSANKDIVVLRNDQLKYLLEYIKKLIDDKVNSNYLIENILKKSNLEGIIADNYKQQSSKDYSKYQQDIDNLILRIDLFKEEMLNKQDSSNIQFLHILSELKKNKLQSDALLTYRLNRCCRKSLFNIENHVKQILQNLINDEKLGFNKYLYNKFVSKEDLESFMIHMQNLDEKYANSIEENNKLLTKEIIDSIKHDYYKDIVNVKQLVTENQEKVTQGISFSDEHIKKIVKKVVAVYDADKTGLVDYAIESMGGQILTTRCTENYKYGKAVVSVLGIPLWYPVNSPRTIITPSINPGECWAFQNFPGFVVIQLSNIIEVQSFSLEHISKMLVPEGRIDSAPKEFEVYGLKSENDKEPIILGRYVYNYDGEPLQFFEVQNRGLTFSIIEVRIISNHGNPNYTCLYRFRVHGKLKDDHI